MDKFLSFLSRALNIIGVTILMLMMFLTVTDVLLRYAFNAPIQGSYEAVELMMAVVFCFGIAYTQRKKGHVSVNLITSKLETHTRSGIISFVSLISLILFILMTWKSFAKAGELMASGETTYGGVGPFGYIPIYPFVYLTSTACLVFCLELVFDFISSLVMAIKK